MAADSGHEERVEHLLDTPELADALGSERFKQFLDHVPVAIAVSQLRPSECIVYANKEFERLTGHVAAELSGKAWNILPGRSIATNHGRQLGEAIADDQDYLGAYTIEHSAEAITVDAWSNLIQDDDGTEVFRLVALADAAQRDDTDAQKLEQLVQEKDTQLHELQHRVKNNLQMITALIRIQARALPDKATGAHFDRLAGRVESLALLYRALGANAETESVDLGIYLSEIASAVMRAHAVEGIHLDLQVDTWPVSVNVAMPAGLVVNELLTNALKHAFVGRDGGTITLHSLVDAEGCRVTIADDGIGLGEGVVWPKAGKLGAMIVHSLRQNAGARLDVHSTPGQGVRVTIFFARADAAPSETADRLPLA